MIKMSINCIRIDLRNQQHVVVLKEESVDRYLPIWIGPIEANAIAVKLQGAEVSRPLSHDLLCSVIRVLGATVRCVIISELEDNVFYAKIVLRVNGEQVEVDSRPSDALALAVRTQAPVYTEESVLNQTGIWLDQETGRPRQANEEKGREISRDELREISAFTDFINTLDLADIGKHES